MVFREGFSKIPEPQVGYELTEANGAGYFTVVIPERSENLVTNPSIEIDTTGYSAVNSTIARSSVKQRRGVYGLKITPNTGVNAGAYYGTITTVTDEWYTFSLDLYSAAGGTVFQIYFADSGGNVISRVQEWTATSRWDRISVNYFETSGASRRLYVIRKAISSTKEFYIDGVQCENKAYSTTYIDGDQKGYLVGQQAYYWEGGIHSSKSTRVADTGSGGKEVKLSDYGFRLLGTSGLGMLPVNVIQTPIANGGAVYQRSTPLPRDFSLIGAITATSNQDYRRIHYKLEQLFTPTRTVTNQPVLIKFYDDSGRVYDIPCVYLDGLGGNVTNLFQERIAINFRQHNPFILESGFGTSITLNTGVPSVSALIYYDGERFVAPLKHTSVLSVTGIYGATVMNNELYICGDFISIEGVAAKSVAKWDGTTWSPLGTGITGGGAYGTCLCNDGTNIYMGGSFATVGGVACANIAKWDGVNWSALGTGLSNYALDCEFYGGNLYVGGNFTTAGGVTVNYIGKWNGAAWSGLGASPGTNGKVRDVYFSGGDLYIAGDFNQMMPGGAGTETNGVAKWSGAAWTRYYTVPSTYASSVVIYDSEIVVARGGTGSPAPGSIEKWDGAAWVDFAEIYGDGSGWKLFVDGDYLYFWGNYSAIDETPASNFARYNGVTWEALNAKFPNDVVNGFFVKFDDKIYMDAGYVSYAGGMAVSRTGYIQEGRAYAQKWGLADPTPGIIIPTIRTICQDVNGKTMYFGAFTDASGTPVFNAAVWDGENWTSMFAGFPTAVWIAQKYKNKNFVHPDPAGVEQIASWNGTLWESIPSTIGGGAASNYAFAVDPTNGDLYLGGAFTTIEGVACVRLGKYSSSTETWSSIGTPNNTVNLIAVDYSGNVYIQGTFTAVDTVSTPGGFAVYDGTTWSSAGITTGTSGGSTNYRGLFVDPQNVLYFYGDFLNFNGTYCGGLAIYSNNAWILDVPVSSGRKDFQKFDTDQFGRIWCCYLRDGLTRLARFVYPNQFYEYTVGNFDTFLAKTINGNIYFNFKYSSYSPPTNIYSSGVLNVSVGGDYLAYPKIRITGKCTLVRIYNLITKQEITFLNLIIPETDTVYLDFSINGLKFYDSAGKNLMGYVSSFSGFWLLPGENLIEISAIDVDQNAAVSIEWDNYHLGINAP